MPSLNTAANFRNLRSGLGGCVVLLLAR